MFTVESLLSIAIEKQALYEALRAKYPSGTINDDRNNARRDMESALYCAEWLESMGCPELANIGPFMTVDLKRGEFVRIKKGARVFGTGPQITRDGKTTVRAQVIRVQDFDKGYIRQLGYDPVGEQGKVHWSGSGGWRWTDVNNIEVV